LVLVEPAGLPAGLAFGIWSFSSFVIPLQCVAKFVWEATHMKEHDQRFKRLLMAFLPEFMEIFFPDWADNFDYTAVEWTKDELIPKLPTEEEPQFVDLLANAPLRPGVQVRLNPVSAPQIRMLIHIEVESADKTAQFHQRMFWYYSTLRIRENLPVLPIGLFLRVGHDGVGWMTHTEELWGENLVQFRYPYIGLPAIDGLDFINAEGPEQPLRYALAALMRRRREIKLNLMERIAGCELDLERKILVFECVNAYLALDPVDQKEFIDTIREHPHMINLPTNKSLQETFRDEGIEQGKLIGVIRYLEKQLGDKITPEKTLKTLSLSQLKTMQTRLKKRLKSES
jgi:hypothetical protein